MKLLAGSPAVLDLYMWIGYRCFRAKSSELIPIFGEFGSANQLGCVEYNRPRRLRAMLEQWLTAIRAIWADCPAHHLEGRGHSSELQTAWRCDHHIRLIYEHNVHKNSDLYEH